jgi:hypothetical protein
VALHRGLQGRLDGIELSPVEKWLYGQVDSAKSDLYLIENLIHEGTYAGSFRKKATVTDKDRRFRYESAMA